MNIDFSTYPVFQPLWTEKNSIEIEEGQNLEESDQNKPKINQFPYQLKLNRRWTKEEDQTLMTWMKIYGCNWEILSPKLNRTARSLQQHYRVHLSKIIPLEEQKQIASIFLKKKKSIHWTLEKEQQLLNYVRKNGVNLIELSKLLGTTQAAIEKRFEKLLKKDPSLSEEFSKLRFCRDKKTDLITPRKRQKYNQNNTELQNQTIKKFYSKIPANSCQAHSSYFNTSLLNTNLRKETDSDLNLLWEKVASCLPAIE